MDIQSYIFGIILEEDRLVEIEVEKALQGGKHGVRVERNRMGRLISAEVHAGVPYGFIHVHIMEEE